MSQVSRPAYVLGHDPDELARLERQAAIYGAATRALFVAAGIGPGQRVLDLGCGAGDVSLLAAELVGPAGQVIGVDRAAPAVGTARRRADLCGASNVTFIESELDALTLAPVDAVVGRFVLMHQPDPAKTLAHAARLLGPGGVVAVMESHLVALGPHWHSWPPSKAYDRLLASMLPIIQAAGGRTDMGLQLRHTFLAAGLPDPALDVHATLAGVDAAAMCRYMADSLRSMRATAGRLGLPCPMPDGIDALEQAMLDDAARPGAVINGPVVVTARTTRA
ncbi:MAG: class I SAM-dependent methyltransferase [Acidobacteria bacterium]|nr:class I SAM-dependent methyltransferase [Acidobacteriota bacterium]